jgi:hypothetical protein
MTAASSSGVPPCGCAHPSLVKRINSLSGSDYKTVALDRAGPYNRPNACEDPGLLRLGMAVWGSCARPAFW